MAQHKRRGEGVCSYKSSTMKSKHYECEVGGWIEKIEPVPSKRKKISGRTMLTDNWDTTSKIQILFFVWIERSNWFTRTHGEACAPCSKQCWLVTPTFEVELNKMDKNGLFVLITTLWFILCFFCSTLISLLIDLTPTKLQRILILLLWTLAVDLIGRILPVCTLHSRHFSCSRLCHLLS